MFGTPGETFVGMKLFFCFNFNFFDFEFFSTILFNLTHQVYSEV